MKTKIVILGLGGVGGYYGGLLAKKYINNPEIEIYFVARGEHLSKVKANGLKLITENETFTVFPTLATNDATEIGVADYVILSTKSYDLEESIINIMPCISGNTIILPLLNGIDITERIQKVLPKNEIWFGCVYIVARLIEPGVVESSGGLHDLFFGLDNTSNEKLVFLEKVFKDAGIKAKLSDNIKIIIWRKFVFISVTASLTSYYNVGFKEIISTKERKTTTLQLIHEVLNIATAEGIKFDFDIVDLTIRHIERIPLSSTSSMHTDFKANKRTELQTITAIVINLAKKHNLHVPTYEMVYNNLKIK